MNPQRYLTSLTLGLILILSLPLSGIQATGLDTAAPHTAEDARLTAFDGADKDLFGASVAMSGDTVVVGAFNADGGGSNRGAAYIYARNQGGTDNWGLVKKLTSSDIADDDWFGGAVAIDGDTVVVGASGEDGAGLDRGAAYVFARNQGGANNWGQVEETDRCRCRGPGQLGQFGRHQRRHGRGGRVPRRWSRHGPRRSLCLRTQPGRRR